MKKKILITFSILFLILGCGSKKNTTETNYSNYETSSIETFLKEIIEKQKSTIETINITEDLEILIVRYDTDKPINPNTGKHPIKEEISIKDEKTTEQTTESNEEEQIDRQQTQDEKKEHQATEDTKVVIEQKESKKLLYIGIIVFCLTVFVGICFAFIKKFI